MDRSANGSVSGSDSRIVIGWSHDSNCAARIRYMKTSDSRNAVTKFCAARPSSLDRPTSTPRYSGPAFSFVNSARMVVLNRRLRRGRQEIAEHRDLPLPGLSADVRRRGARLEVGHVLERHAAQTRGRHGQTGERALCCSILAAGAQVHLVLLAALVVRRHLVATDQQSQGVGRIRDLDAEVGRLRPVDTHAEFRLAHVQGRVGIDDAWDALHLVEQLAADALELVQIRAVDGELDGGALGAAAADERDFLHGRSEVPGEGRQNLLADGVHHLELIAPPRFDRLQPDVDVGQIACLGRIAGDGDEGVVDFRNPLPDRPGDPVGQHLGGLQTRALRRAQVDLELRLIVERQEVLVRHDEQRHARQQDEHGHAGHERAVRDRPLAGASCRPRPPRGRPSSPSNCACPCRDGRTLSQRAASIGVSVKLTSSDTRMANAIVRPKLFMKRPTMPPMNPTGTKMATSDSVVARTARPISLVASMAAWCWSSCFSSMNR